MTPNLIEIIAIGVLAFIVLYGVLELLWAAWDGRKPAPNNRSH